MSTRHLNSMSLGEEKQRWCSYFLGWSVVKEKRKWLKLCGTKIIQAGDSLIGRCGFFFFFVNFPHLPDIIWGLFASTPLPFLSFLWSFPTSLQEALKLLIGNSINLTRGISVFIIWQAKFYSAKEQVYLLTFDFQWTQMNSVVLGPCEVSKF